MPVTFQIFPKRGLVLVEFTGFSTVDDLKDASAAYLIHADYELGQKQLIDLTGIVEFEMDYVRFMKLQADKAERLEGAGVQSLAVYVAPTPKAQEVATMFTRTWTNSQNVVTMVQHNEVEALALLGQPETSIDNLLAAAGHKRTQTVSDD